MTCLICGSLDPFNCACVTQPGLDPAASLCTRYNPCGKAACTDCYPGKILAPEQRGKAKRRKAEQGYRVVASVEYFKHVPTEKQGTLYFTRDLALLTAKRKARAEQRAYLIFEDGVLRWTIFADGSEQHHPPGGA